MKRWRQIFHLRPGSAHTTLSAGPRPEEPFTPRELWLVLTCSILLIWTNAYICRELFYRPNAFMNSMHGAWIAIAQSPASSWFQPTWWPYWDAGIPFEFTYAPLVPVLTKIWSSLGHMPVPLASQSLTGLVYCLIPVTLFTTAWLLTRAVGYSFAAALFYSLTAPTQILAPDVAFSLKSIWDARRLMTAVAWDDTPHLLAVAILPLIVLFLSLSIRRRRAGYYAAAALCIALATLASAFGMVLTIMAAVGILFALGRRDLKRRAILTILIGASGYALSAAFYPPSLIHAMRVAANGIHGERVWTLGSLTAMAIVTLIGMMLWRALPRWTLDWRLQLFAVLAYLTSAIPMIAALFHLQFLPQATRYKPEMEVGLALFLVFWSRSWFDRLSNPIKGATVFLLLTLVGQQIVSYRVYAKKLLVPADVTQTVEYRAASWANHNLPGVRVMLPGSVSLWANAFEPIQQFSGSSWSMAYNPTQQLGLAYTYFSADSPQRDAELSLAWMRAFGVGAVGISAPDSKEYWKSFAHPDKFEGVLPVIWRQDGVTLYKISRRSESFAHMLPESSLVKHPPKEPRDTAGLEAYASALEDPAMPPAQFQWEGTNRARIRTAAVPDQVMSIQVSYHPGWHARVNGHERALQRDGLGLMWLKPECSGPCEVQIAYDGGVEWALCRGLSCSTLAGLLLMVPARRRLRTPIVNQPIPITASAGTTRF